MPRFRKKPVEIEARQLTIKDAVKVISWMNQPEYLDGEATPVAELAGDGFLITGVEIPTLEGVMLGSLDDWIIKGVEEEFYACKPEIFEKTYELVDEDE